MQQKKVHDNSKISEFLTWIEKKKFNIQEISFKTGITLNTIRSALNRKSCKENTYLTLLGALGWEKETWETGKSPLVEDKVLKERGIDVFRYDRALNSYHMRICYVGLYHVLNTETERISVSTIKRIRDLKISGFKNLVIQSQPAPDIPGLKAVFYSVYLAGFPPRIKQIVTGAVEPWLKNDFQIDENIDAEFVMDGTGTGTHIYNGKKLIVAEGQTQKNRKIKIWKNVAFAAGHGFIQDEAEQFSWIELDEFFAKKLNVSGSTEACEIEGNSMEPTIPSRSVVFFQRTDEIKEGKIHLVFYSGQQLMKRIQKTNNGMRLISDNPAYLPVDVREEPFKSFGIVESHIARQ